MFLSFLCLVTKKFPPGEGMFKRREASPAMAVKGHQLQVFCQASSGEVVACGISREDLGFVLHLW